MAAPLLSLAPVKDPSFCQSHRDHSLPHWGWGNGSSCHHPYTRVPVMPVGVYQLQEEGNRVIDTISDFTPPIPVTAIMAPGDMASQISKLPNFSLSCSINVLQEAIRSFHSAGLSHLTDHLTFHFLPWITLTPEEILQLPLPCCISHPASLGTLVWASLNCSLVFIGCCSSFSAFCLGHA